MTSESANRYVRPGGVDTVFNRVVGLLSRAGVSLAGARTLAVKGRNTGIWRTTPVNVLVLDGVRYLVAPRGQAEWVRNMRVAGGGELRLGSKIERITTTELADADKPPVIRAYLKRWGWEVERFFDGLTKQATADQLREAAPGIPVFRVE